MIVVSTHPRSFLRVFLLAFKTILEVGNDGTAQELNAQNINSHQYLFSHILLHDTLSQFLHPATAKQIFFECPLLNITWCQKREFAGTPFHSKKSSRESE